MIIKMELLKKSKLIKFLVLFLPIVLLFTHCTNSEKQETENENLIVLKNGNTTLKVLPSMGGRIVSFQRNNSNNILKSDPNLWNYKFERPVDELILNDMIPFNGHIVWVGPQSEWWINQDIDKELKKRASDWPPDPYLIYGDYKVIKKTGNYVKLRGPKSEYTGIQLTKDITLKENGKVVFTVEAQNIREEPIAWDLWLNTRMDGFDKVYVPIANENDLRMEHRVTETTEEMPYKIDNGYFHFETLSPPANKSKRYGKAFIYPSKNELFAFTKNDMFVIHFKKYSRKLVHPEQGLIEIYNSVTDSGDALMEIEYHTPYQVIQPKEKISGKEVWEVVEYRNGNNTEDHIDFINVYLDLKKKTKRNREYVKLSR